MLPVEQWANRSWVAVPIQIGEEEWELNQLKLNDVELMQYTGLKDKNGKEIYEGDILTDYDPDGELFNNECARDRIWVVEYGTKNGNNIVGSFVIRSAHRNTVAFAVTGDWIELLKVIGNIYENPELLKQ